MFDKDKCKKKIIKMSKYLFCVPRILEWYLTMGSLWSIIDKIKFLKQGRLVTK